MLGCGFFPLSPTLRLHRLFEQLRASIAQIAGVAESTAAARLQPICALHFERRECRSPRSNGASKAKPVFNLQHLDSFDQENPWKHKNAAFDHGFCLPEFLKMALVRVRRASRDCNGDLKS
jgi:hypothetical protein